MNTIRMPILIVVLSLSLLGSGCTSSSTLVPTLEPAPTNSTSNDVLISFTINASDGMDELSACLAANNIYRFVLYRDGHLIKYDGVQYGETQINQAEIDDLLSEIETTGFSSLAGAGDQYVQNAPLPFFDYPWGGLIAVNEKTIMVTPDQSDYLVEAVIQTLDIIENYNSENLKAYVPETATLWVFLEENISLGLANPTPESPMLNWSVEQIDLDNLLVDPVTSKPQVIVGDSLSFLMRQLKHVPALRKVEQNGQIYLIVLCPNFP